MSINNGVSCRAAGRSVVTSGLVFSAKAVSALRVSCDSCSKVGSAMKVCCSSALRLAVVWKTWLALVISDDSWPSRSDSAVEHLAGVRDQLLHRRLLGEEDRHSWLASVASGDSVPKASLIACPCP